MLKMEQKKSLRTGFRLIYPKENEDQFERFILPIDTAGKELSFVDLLMIFFKKRNL
jgi:hypothetical protein